VRPAILLLLLASAPAAWCQAADADRSPAEIIAACSKSASNDVVGLTAVEQACSGLTDALEKAGYLPLLSIEQRETLTFDELDDLGQIGERYAAEARGPSADVASLPTALESLRELNAERPLTWLDRFEKWLRAFLERGQGQSDSDSWLSRWLQDVDISETVAKGIVYGIEALVVIFALGVVVNELRVAGVLRGWRRQTQASKIAAGQHDPAAIETSSSPDAVPTLLRALVSTLVRGGRLRTERSLTHRELCVQATFDDAQQRECFRSLAALAERAVYGGGELPADEVDPVMAAARELNAQLSGAAS
jgi:hypothetical protein